MACNHSQKSTANTNDKHNSNEMKNMFHCKFNIYYNLFMETTRVHF